MVERVWNFSPGPGALPLPVLERVRDELLEYPGAGASILEISHRSPAFERVIEEAEANLRDLLGIPSTYRVLFLQGGASLQFSMVPMNLLLGSAGYVLTGSWGKKAHAEAIHRGDVRAVWDGAETGYTSVPPSLDGLADGLDYLHVTSNETIEGVEFPPGFEPADGPPLVCDASSDLLSRPIPVERYGLLYAGAQKNAGAGGAHDRRAPRGPARTDPARRPDDARLPHVRGAPLAVQHAAGVRDLRPDAGHPLAPRRDRRARGDGRAQPREGLAAVRRDRRLGRLLPRSRRRDRAARG